MGLKFNPLLKANFDLVGRNPLLAYGDKLQFHLSSLAAYDKISSITYLDEGLETQRVDMVTISSVAYPNADIVKSVFYLDIGSINQRIEKIEYVGSVFSPDNLRKVFNYSLVGIKYKLDSTEYELF